MDLDRTGKQFETPQIPGRPRPLWNLISLAAPIIAGVAFIAWRPQHGSPIIGDFGAFIFAGVYGSPIGVVSAVVALIRSERKGWLSALGMLVNLPLFALLLVFSGFFGPL